jgi:hypothetical protein
MDNQGVMVLFLAGVKDFSLSHSVHTSTGGYPASYPMGSGYYLPCGKAGYSSPSSVEVKNVYSYFSPSLYVIMSWCSIQQRQIYLYCTPLISSFSDSNIFPLYICNFCSSLKLRHYISHPYKTGKATVLYILIFSILDAYDNQA